VPAPTCVNLRFCSSLNIGLGPQSRLSKVDYLEVS
jgi:hypothetical protein